MTRSACQWITRPLTAATEASLGIGPWAAGGKGNVAQPSRTRLPAGARDPTGWPGLPVNQIGSEIVTVHWQVAARPFPGRVVWRRNQAVVSAGESEPEPRPGIMPVIASCPGDSGGTGTE